jgi:hypothetical protein
MYIGTAYPELHAFAPDLSIPLRRTPAFLHAALADGSESNREPQIGTRPEKNEKRELGLKPNSLSF